MFTDTYIDRGVPEKRLDEKEYMQTVKRLLNTNSDQPGFLIRWAGLQLAQLDIHSSHCDASRVSDINGLDRTAHHLQCIGITVEMMMIDGEYPGKAIERFIEIGINQELGAVEQFGILGSGLVNFNYRFLAVLMCLAHSIAWMEKTDACRPVGWEAYLPPRKNSLSSSHWYIDSPFEDISMQLDGIFSSLRYKMTKFNDDMEYGDLDRSCKDYLRCAGFWFEYLPNIFRKSSEDPHVVECRENSLTDRVLSCPYIDTMAHYFEPERCRICGRHLFDWERCDADEVNSYEMLQRYRIMRLQPVCRDCLFKFTDELAEEARRHDAEITEIGKVDPEAFDPDDYDEEDEEEDE